ncbi:MAG: DUF4384 domain-containing protein [Gemmatimonadetes bacterium]|nr:DUF4384 domain-containing protein [Gemmatimonadota bacterium]
MMLNLGLAALVGMTPAQPVMLADRHQIGRGPSIEVWTNNDEVFRRGEQVRVYFRTSESGYVTVFRIDTDGRVRVLYPREPWEDNYARAGERYEVRSYGDRYAFSVDDYPGQGYVFGVVSADPFAYDALVRGDHWDYRVIAAGGRVTGDPYVALTDLVDRIIPPNYDEYSYDVMPYYVEQHYDYPRFLCYDCHAYASYRYWNPYSYSCFRFRIVIYDDYYYYPYRRYGGTRVLYRSSPRLAPRYVFKDRGGPNQPYVTTVRERPVDATGRRVLDAGVTSRDLGGPGRVPAPITTGRQQPATSGDAAGGATGGRRLLDPGQASGARQPDARTQTDGGRAGVIDPRERPRRPDEGANTQQGDNQGGRRRTDGAVTTQPDEGRQQPQLERRDPRREPETQVQSPKEPRRDQPREATPGEDSRREPVREQPRRVPDRTQIEPAREPERRAEPRPEPRSEPRSEPRAEPRRVEPREQPRAEPRSEPRAEPRAAPRSEPSSEPRRVEKPQDPEGDGRRPN